MNKYWSKIITKLVPYKPGDQPNKKNIIKLNTNENPYPPSKNILYAIYNELGMNAESLRLYPDPDSYELRKVISEYYKLCIDQIFIGNGSDEVLSIAFQAFFKHNKPIIFPDITYSFYSTYSHLYDIEYKLIPLNKDLYICSDDYLKYNNDICGIVFSNPNSPTGHSISLYEIENIIKNNQNSIIIVDEAYVDFGSKSAIKLVNMYSNLLVVQTLSKSRSLAGIRVGFAVGNNSLIKALMYIKNSFNSYPVDRLAQVISIAAYKDKTWFNKTVNKIIKNRNFLEKHMKQLNFEVVKSSSNFLFVKHNKRCVFSIINYLKKYNIYVRNFQKPSRISQYLRISIGKKSECIFLLKMLSRFI